MARLLVTVNDRPLMAGIRAAIVRGEDPRPALERVADDFLEMERNQFSTQGGSGGTPWAPLSAEWAANRRSTNGILVGSVGRMRRSLTTERARGSVRRITVQAGRRSSVEMGSTHPLAHLHERGTAERYVRTWRGKPLATPRSAGKLPARPVVVVGPRDEARWRSIIADHFLGSKSLGL